MPVIDKPTYVNILLYTHGNFQEVTLKILSNVFRGINPEHQLITGSDILLTVEREVSC